MPYLIPCLLTASSRQRSLVAAWVPKNRGGKGSAADLPPRTLGVPATPFVAPHETIVAKPGKPLPRPVLKDKSTMPVKTKPGAYAMSEDEEVEAEAARSSPIKRGARMTSEVSTASSL